LGGDCPGGFRDLLRRARRGRRPGPKARVGSEIRGDLLIRLGARSDREVRPEVTWSMTWRYVVLLPRLREPLSPMCIICSVARRHRSNDPISLDRGREDWTGDARCLMRIVCFFFVSP